MVQSAAAGAQQTVFVMMPFESDFDDVYAAVKDSIAVVDKSFAAVRLDEIRAAGSITDDMIAEIRKATLCVADVTNANPNVMWEVGFATALGKPVVAISQEAGRLPFDIKDVRTLTYKRTSLAKTLRDPLTEAFKDTLERYLLRRSGLQTEQQKPHLRTIAVTGTMTVSRTGATERLERLLSPYIGADYHWYVGSFGGADESALSYLIRSGEQSITVVGHTSYDLSEGQLRTLEANRNILFLDAKREQLLPVSGAPSKRDVLLASRADLLILIWDRQSEGTKALIDWLADIGKDHIVGFVARTPRI